MRASEINADAWADGNIESRCLVGEKKCDPWSIDAAESQGTPVAIEVAIASEVLRFEVGQSEIDLKNNDDLLKFMTREMERHPMETRLVCLDMVRAILKPRRPPGMLKRMFGLVEQTPIQWHWVSVTSMASDGPVLVVRGLAVPV